MIRSVAFLKDYRCFKKGEKIEFHPGVNLLVGEQGCGKSSLIGVLRNRSSGTDHQKDATDKIIKIVADKCSLMSFDFEKDHARTGNFRDDVNYRVQISMRWSSHGEVVNAILRVLSDPTYTNTAFVMDEPDMALSMRSCTALSKLLNDTAARGCQIVAAVHSQTVISLQDEVLSLEHRKWMPSAEFIAAHLDRT